MNCYTVLSLRLVKLSDRDCWYPGATEGLFSGAGVRQVGPVTRHDANGERVEAAHGTTAAKLLDFDHGEIQG